MVQCNREGKEAVASSAGNSGEVRARAVTKQMSIVFADAEPAYRFTDLNASS